jgi:hypothetical protein
MSIMSAQFPNLLPLIAVAQGTNAISYMKHEEAPTQFAKLLRSGYKSQISLGERLEHQVMLSDDAVVHIAEIDWVSSSSNSAKALVTTD